MRSTTWIVIHPGEEDPRTPAEKAALEKLWNYLLRPRPEEQQPIPIASRRKTKPKKKVA
jgi:hypothetical protein